MQLVMFLLIITFISIMSFWISGTVYGLIRKPSIYFPITLAIKMAICSVFGSLMFMIGGVILSTFVFNYEMQKRADYKKWPTIISGLFISILCTVSIYFSTITLAWKILD